MALSVGNGCRFAQGRRHNTMLMEAIYYREADKAQTADCESGADVNAENRYGMTPMFLSRASGDG